MMAGKQGGGMWAVSTLSEITRSASPTYTSDQVCATPVAPVVCYLSEPSHHFLVRHVYNELECGAAEEGRTRMGRWLRLNGQLL